MKKTLLIAIGLFTLTIANAQIVGRSAPNCPAGQHPVLTYACDLAFHRPKFDCESGFWFCFSNCTWTSSCVGDLAFRSAEREFSNEVIGELVGDNFVIHFPKGAVERSNLSAVDKSTINVDDALQFVFNGKKVTLIKGDYSTQETEYEIIATIPVKSD